MRRSWIGSVVAGLLVLAPVAAIAQSGLGDEPEVTESEELAAERSEEALDEEVDTLVLVDETETDDVDEDGDGPADAGNDHGERVSSVARCAPTGKLDVDGFRNHGAFVRAVAHGDTVTVEGTAYDLSTSEGVEALCAWAGSYEPPAAEGAANDDDADTDTAASSRPEGDRGHGKPDRAGKPDHAGGKKADAGGASPNGNGAGRGQGKKGR